MVHRLTSALIVAMAVVLAHGSGTLRPLEHWLTELRFGHATRAPTGDIVLVDVDAKSIEAIGRWPWPRSVHADLLDALIGLEASEIALDIDLSASSTLSEDAALEAALERANGLVILPIFKQRRSSDASDSEIVYNRPIARFARQSWGAIVNVRPDRDGTVRSLPYGEIVAGEPIASIPAIYGGHVGEVEGEFLVDFGIVATKIDRIPVIDVLRGNVEGGRIAGKKIVIGASALELRDLFRVPVHGVVSGSLLQALGAETILQGRALHRISGPISVIGMFLIVTAVVFGLRRARLVPLLGILVLSSLILEMAAIILQGHQPTALDTSAWHAALLVLAVFAMVREIDFRRVLLAISKNEAENAQMILDQVISDNFAGVVVADEDGTIHAASRIAGELLGFGPVPLAGRKIADVLPSALAGSLREAVEAFRSGARVARRPQEIEYAFDRDGPRLLECVVTPSRLGGGVSQDGDILPDHLVACLTFQDVTERRRADARLAYMARFDVLTGLPNRNQFCDQLSDTMGRMRSNGKFCAVACLDLDRFKAVNDSFGHYYGDLLLCAVADRLRELVGPGDFSARFGGDEYAIIMSSMAGREDMASLAERLISGLGEPYDISGRRPVIGVSLGIAIVEGGNIDPLAILKNADIALYRAKAAGGNAYRFFDAEMAVGLRSRQAMEVDLWDAFKRKEFEVFYQPQIDLGTRAIVGVEALLRWRHPQRGFVSPENFIPIAEETGLIEPLGAWVLGQACSDVVSWPGEVKVAVNVSAAQFTRSDMVKTVAGALARSGLPAERLDLEITESLFIHDSRLTEEAIRRLREMGISLALDDFGTGYASLGYLRKFPIAKLKIDKSFVTRLPLDADSLAIVKAVTALAQGLNLRVTAEGIETPEQMQLLRLLGCDEGQGYLFGKPQTATDIMRLLAHQPQDVSLFA
jgi:diguanylate cyclase (GGDEF)-like protein